MNVDPQRRASILGAEGTGISPLLFQKRENRKSLPRNECRSLGARFHSGSRKHEDLTAFMLETGKLANRLPGMNVDPWGRASILGAEGTGMSQRLFQKRTNW